MWFRLLWRFEACLCRMRNLTVSVARRNRFQNPYRVSCCASTNLQVNTMLPGWDPALWVTLPRHFFNLKANLASPRSGTTASGNHLVSADVQLKRRRERRKCLSGALLIKMSSIIKNTIHSQMVLLNTHTRSKREKRINTISGLVRSG